MHGAVPRQTRLPRKCRAADQNVEMRFAIATGVPRMTGMACTVIDNLEPRRGKGRFEP